MRLCIGLAFAILLAANVYGSSDHSEINTHSNENENQKEDNTKMEEDITELSEITHYTKELDMIDISLSKELYTETCLIKTPGSDMIPVETLTIDNVKIQPTTNFVSCRISIGPMNRDLIGDWKLCGMSDAGKIRCQTVHIVWYNTAFPSLRWQVQTELRVEHPVHFGGMVNTGISETSRYAGSIETCHLITPNGEDLVLKADTTYPNIHRTELDSRILCAVIIDINNNNMLGDWVIYAKYRSGNTQNEIRMPLTFFLYNEDNPYEQAYNVTERTKAKHIVTPGETYIEKLSGSGQITECFYVMPSGVTNTLASSSTSKDGIMLKELENEFACVLTIASITEDMLGTWQFIAKFNNENQFNEKQRHFQLVKEELRLNSEESEGLINEDVDEESEDEENIKLLNEINHFTKQQDLIDISLNNEAFEEECYVHPPNGGLLKATDLNMDGVKVQARSMFVSCRITIGPMTSELLGTWRLCGKSVTTKKMRCQPSTIAWNSNNGISNWDTVTRLRFNHPVHFGGAVNSGVLGTGTVNTCHVITPAGEDLVLTTDIEYPYIERNTLENPSLCSVIIKDIARDLIGDWIIYGRFRSILGQNEVRLPINLFLYDENNPYTQAYNVTVNTNQQYLVNLGTDITMQVKQIAGEVEDCIYTLPTGQVFNTNNEPTIALDGVSFKSADSQALCQVILDPITETFTGEWQIVGKFRNGLLHDEIQQTFNIIKEDPANPIPDVVERTVQILPPQVFTTSMETNHRIVITSNSLIENESCHIIRPDGLQYAFIPGFNVSGVQIISESGVECGVLLTLESEDMIGEWTLIARSMWLNTPTERRQSITFRVEENFVIQDVINIREGANLYLHLHDLPTVKDTCMLYGPDGTVYTEAETDPVYLSWCGYIIRNVNQNHTGEWIIEYGNQKKYRGSIGVNILKANDISIDNLHWYTGDSVNITLGPEDTVYCKIEDSRGHVLFDGFGQCNIFLNRVTLDHRGTWKIFVAAAGSVLMTEYGFYVDVQARVSTPQVTTSVQRIRPSVMLTCSVPAGHNVRSCKFRDPAGKILVAAHSVGEGGYIFNNTPVHYETYAQNHDCTLRLTDPSVLDLGIWRCAVDTATGTYYGFLTVVCPYLMQQPEVAASIITEPLLEAETTLSYLEDEPVVMSCNIPTQIRYCYFRSRNGSVFNVFPGMPSQNFEYVGAGLDAGECGIRFSSLTSQESGRWSCHVGLNDMNAEEQRADLVVEVQAKMTVRHLYQGRSMVVVEAVVYDQHPIEYCRFVKIDGQGFTSDNVPDRYHLLDGLHTGHCSLYATNPDIIDLHPWTVAVKLSGQVGEISMTTTENLLQSLISSKTNILSHLFFWLLIICICLITLIAVSALGPKKNREWTFRRASRLSNSFRNSWNNTFKKNPKTQQVV